VGDKSSAWQFQSKGESARDSDVLWMIDDEPVISDPGVRRELDVTVLILAGSAAWQYSFDTAGR